MRILVLFILIVFLGSCKQNSKPIEIKIDSNIKVKKGETLPIQQDEQQIWRRMNRRRIRQRRRKDTTNKPFIELEFYYG